MGGSWSFVSAEGHPHCPHTFGDICFLWLFDPWVRSVSQTGMTQYFGQPASHWLASLMIVNIRSDSICNCMAGSMVANASIVDRPRVSSLRSSFESELANALPSKRVTVGSFPTPQACTEPKIP